jgi:hypothetical protein
MMAHHRLLLLSSPFGNRRRPRNWPQWHFRAKAPFLPFVLATALSSSLFLLFIFFPRLSSANILLYRLLADPVAREEEHKPQRNPKRAPGAGYAQQPAPRKVRNRTRERWKI